jgi:hypothetical protein
MARDILRPHRTRTWIVEFLKRKKALSQYRSGKPEQSPQLRKYMGFEEASETRDSESGREGGIRRGGEGRIQEDVGQLHHFAIFSVFSSNRYSSQ